MYSHLLYGCVVHSPMPLPAPLAPPSSPPDITISPVNTPLDATDFSAGAADVTYARLADGSVFVRWYDRFEFMVSSDGSTLKVFRNDDSDDEALYAYLLGQGLSVALLQRGREALHAAAFAMNGHAIALLGDCGYGKSTIAAYALRAGARLLTDDLLIFHDLAVLPGPARIKLQPEMAAATIGVRSGTPMYDARGKWIYALDEAEYAATPVELSRIFVLQPDASEVRTEPLDHGTAFKALLSATFNPLEQSAPRLASHMRYHAALAHSVPVFRLHVPRRIADIGKVIEAIEFR